MRTKYILLFIFLVIVVIISIIMQKTYDNLVEGYDNMNKDIFDSIYTSFYNNTFSSPDLYRNDINNVVPLMKDKSIILDAGCGCGRHYEQLVNNGKKVGKVVVIGVDNSKNMLKHAEIRNPSGKFVNGDLENEKLFKPKQFSEVVCMLDTLYHNNYKKMDKILENFYYWMKMGGNLCIHIFERDKLDPGPREYSQYYKDDDKLKHSLTYFDKYSHDAYWYNDVKKDHVYYVEKYILKNGKVKKRETKMYIPKDKRVIIEKIMRQGFELKDIKGYDKSGISDFKLYVFKKRDE